MMRECTTEEIIIDGVSYSLNCRRKNKIFGIFLTPIPPDKALVGKWLEPFFNGTEDEARAYVQRIHEDRKSKGYPQPPFGPKPKNKDTWVAGYSTYPFTQEFISIEEEEVQLLKRLAEIQKIKDGHNNGQEA